MTTGLWRRELIRLLHFFIALHTCNSCRYGSMPRWLTLQWILGVHFWQFEKQLYLRSNYMIWALRTAEDALGMPKQKGNYCHNCLILFSELPFVLIWYFLFNILQCFSHLFAAGVFCFLFWKKGNQLSKASILGKTWR